MLFGACGEHRTTDDFLMDVRENYHALSLRRDAGHLDTRNLKLTVLQRNVIRTVQLKEMIMRRN